MHKSLQLIAWLFVAGTPLRAADPLPAAAPGAPNPFAAPSTLPYESPRFGDRAAEHYTWSEVLARDTGLWFHRHGGLDRANGDFFRAKVLSRGRTEEPGRLFEQFYGGPAEIGPLLEYRGLTAPLHNAGPHTDPR